MIIANNSKLNPLPHGIENSGYIRLNTYKFDVINLLLQNQNLLKLLKYPDTNPLDMPDLSQNEKDEILYNYIYPFPKNPNFNDKVKANVYIDFAKGIPTGNSFKGLILTIDITVDENCNKTIYGTRDILIMDLIDKDLMNSRGLGFGQLQGQGFGRITLNTNQIAYRLAYIVVDLR